MNYTQKVHFAKSVAAQQGNVLLGYCKHVTLDKIQYGLIYHIISHAPIHLTLELIRSLTTGMWSISLCTSVGMQAFLLS